MVVVDVSADGARQLPVLEGGEELNVGVLVKRVFGRIEQRQAVHVEGGDPVRVVAIELPGELGQLLPLLVGSDRNNANLRRCHR